MPKRSHLKQAHVGLISGITEFTAESTREMAMGPGGALVRCGRVPLHIREAATARKGSASLTSIRN